MYRVFLLCVFLIAYASLYPWRFDTARDVGNPLSFLLHATHIEKDLSTLKDVAINFLVYIPLGFLGYGSAHRLRSKSLRIALPVLFALVFSACIEMIQIYDSTRFTSLIDVIFNTGGALAGAIAASIGLALLRTSKVASLVRPEATGSLLLLACWAGYQLMTVLPDVHLEVSSELLRPTVTIFGINAAAYAVEWLIAAKMAESIFGLAHARWFVAILVSMLPFKFVIGRHRIYWAEVVGVLIAWVLWRPLESRRPFPDTSLAMLFCVLLVLRGLAPFRFSAHPHPFAWIPFSGLFRDERQSGLVVLARKMFDYGAPLWLLYRTRMPIFPAAAGVALVLAFIELMQTHIPGRSAEITDPLLALLCAMMLWSLRQKSPSAGPLGKTRRPAGK